MDAPPPNPPAGAENATNHVIRAILGYLRERNLQAGDKLPSERALAEKLEVGRNTLREGLAALITLRVVEGRPNSGIYLRKFSSESSLEALAVLANLGSPPTQQEIEESMEVRTALEFEAVKRACVRREDKDLQCMAEILGRTEEMLRKGGNIAELDTEFHLALVASGHNSMMVRALNTFYRFTAQRRRVVFANPKNGELSLRDHWQLYNLIVARDIDGAQDLMRRHMGRATSYWTEVLL